MDKDLPSIARAEAAVKSLEAFAHQFSPRSHAAVTITGGGAMGLLVSLIAVGGLFYAAFAVRETNIKADGALQVMAEARRADAEKVNVLLRENEELQRRTEVLEIQFRKIDPRVSALENQR